MKQKVLTGTLLVGILGPILYFGGLAFDVLVILFLFLGSLEIADIYKKEWPSFMRWLVVIITFGVAFAPIEYFMVTLVSLLILLFTLSVLFENIHFFSITYLFVMLTIVALAVKGFIYFESLSSLVIFYVAVATYMADTAAYFVGVTMGKHKLAPRVSPNKTIEGAVGGWLFGSIATFAFGYFMLMDILGFNIILLTSILLPFVGMLGDLAFSLIKRHYQIKDFGSLFPAHGGVLDRIDSLLFASVFFYSILLVML